MYVVNIRFICDVKVYLLTYLYQVGDQTILLMFEWREGSWIFGNKIGVLTDVADKPKALPYWLRVNLRKLV